MFATQNLNMNLVEVDRNIKKKRISNVIFVKKCVKEEIILLDITRTANIRKNLFAMSVKNLLIKIGCW